MPNGGPAVTVRSDGAVMPVVSPERRHALFRRRGAAARRHDELRNPLRSPGERTSQLLARIPAHRIGDGMFHAAISPAGEWLALPLTDGVTANIWGISTRDGSFRALTSFGHRPTFITRRVSWSPDGKLVPTRGRRRGRRRIFVVRLDTLIGIGADGPLWGGASHGATTRRHRPGHPRIQNDRLFQREDA